MQNIQQLIAGIMAGDFRSLARAVTLVENELPGYEEILQQLNLTHQSKIIGVTGPPGAGKSTLINAMLNELASNFKVAVLAVDPSSPFTQGSLLGDRLRMSDHFNSSNVFIRSVATRGTLGGLSAKTFETVDLLRAFKFDYIFIETVGVGQSEVEIASLADTTVVVYVPESGDEVQMLKSGVMEIADVFIINKSDRDGAAILEKNIINALHERAATNWQIPVLKTVATQNSGIKEVIEKINLHHQQLNHKKKIQLLASKAFHLIQTKRMKDVTINTLCSKIEIELQNPDFNLYKLVKLWN